MQKGIIVHTLTINEEGKILLLKRAKSNDVLPEYWDIPGGTLEDGEDPALGAIREAKEEAGIDISNPKLFFHMSNVDVKKNKQFITLIFRATLFGTSVTLNPEEHEDCAWIQPEELGNYKTVNYLAGCLDAYLELKTNPMN